MKAAVGDKTYKNSLLWLWHVVGKYKVCILLLIAAQVIFGICGVAFAILFRDLIDQAAAGNRDGFFKAAQMLIGLEVVHLAVGAFARFLVEWTRSTLENRLKGRLFSCLLHKDYAAVTAVHSGEWITRLTSDTVEVTGGVIDIFPSIAGMLVRLIGAMAALFFLAPVFFYLLIPVGVFLLLLTSSFRKLLKRLHKKIQEANGIVLSFFQERLESLLIIKGFSMEKQTCEEAEHRMQGHKLARLKRNHFSNLCNTGLGIAAGGGYVLAAVYCGYGILRGNLSYGTFTAILQLIEQIQTPFANISGVVPRYYAMLASAERLRDAESFEEDGNDAAVEKNEIARFYREDFESIGVRNAGFSYLALDKENSNTASRIVIENFNLEIHKGEYVAFTGHSGCGKSTLLKLLMCLYPLDYGDRYMKVHKEGKSEVEIPLTPAWRGLFAYVPQGNQLMSGTIREIIAFGDKTAMRNEERLTRALALSCADECVRELENGLDTLLGERGCGLSEGQMQRIAIARAVFSDRPILILDESTSALDEQTEEKLLENLRQMTDKTVLLITHRPAALRICDRKIAMSESE